MAKLMTNLKSSGGVDKSSDLSTQELLNNFYGKNINNNRLLDDKSDGDGDIDNNKPTSMDLLKTPEKSNTVLDAENNEHSKDSKELDENRKHCWGGAAVVDSTTKTPNMKTEAKEENGGLDTEEEGVAAKRSRVENIISNISSPTSPLNSSVGTGSVCMDSGTDGGRSSSKMTTTADGDGADKAENLSLANTTNNNNNNNTTDTSPKSKRKSYQPQKEGSSSSLSKLINSSQNGGAGVGEEEGSRAASRVNNNEEEDLDQEEIDRDRAEQDKQLKQQHQHQQHQQRHRMQQMMNVGKENGGGLVGDFNLSTMLASAGSGHGQTAATNPTDGGNNTTTSQHINQYNKLQELFDIQRRQYSQWLHEHQKRLSHQHQQHQQQHPQQQSQSQSSHNPNSEAMAAMQAAASIGLNQNGISGGAAVSTASKDVAGMNQNGGGNNQNNSFSTSDELDRAKRERERELKNLTTSLKTQLISSLSTTVDKMLNEFMQSDIHRVQGQLKSAIEAAQKAQQAQILQSSFQQALSAANNSNHSASVTATAAAAANPYAHMMNPFYAYGAAAAAYGNPNTTMQNAMMGSAAAAAQHPSIFPGISPAAAAANGGSQQQLSMSGNGAGGGGGGGGHGKRNGNGNGNNTSAASTPSSAVAPFSTASFLSGNSTTPFVTTTSTLTRKEDNFSLVGMPRKKRSKVTDTRISKARETPLDPSRETPRQSPAAYYPPTMVGHPMYGTNLGEIGNRDVDSPAYSDDPSDLSPADPNIPQSCTLTPMHLRKAKLMFFYTRYPSSSLLKTYFPDIRFNKNNTAQLVKWFSNFREFYYIQMEKYARQALAEGVRRPEEITVTLDSELYKTLNQHYNRNSHIQVPGDYREVVEATLREFYLSIQGGKDLEASWKKQIYKVIARLDTNIPEYFKNPNFLEQLE